MRLNLFGNPSTQEQVKSRHEGKVKLIGEQPFHGLRFEGKRYDCGDKLGFLEANLAFALARDDVAPALRKVIADLL